MVSLKQESKIAVIPGTQTKKALELGPLESVFSCSTSKVLDFMITFSEWDYSITDIAKNSGLSFKTGFDEVKRLEVQGILVKSRTVGKAIMYKLNKESNQTQSIMKVAFDVAKKRAEKLEVKESAVATKIKKTARRKVRGKK